MVNLFISHRMPSRKSLFSQKHLTRKPMGSEIIEPFVEAYGFGFPFKMIQSISFAGMRARAVPARASTSEGTIPFAA